MNKYIYWLFEPLQQTKFRIALNLLMAPLGGLLLVYLPFSLFITVMSYGFTGAELVLNKFYVIFVVALLCYLLFLYLPLLLFFLILKDFDKFNLFSILMGAVITSPLFAYMISAQPIWKTLVTLLLFIIPTSLFFIFLSFRSHGKYQQFIQEEAHIRQG